MAEPKEGVDFEWVLMKNQPKGGTNKTRRFFTKAEKQAKNAPALVAKAAPTKKATPKVVTKEKPVTKDAMKGYRAGDVKSSKIPRKYVAGVDGPQDPPRADAPPSPRKKEPVVPGRAIVKAIKNAWNGSGSANPTGVMRGANRTAGATGTWDEKKPKGK